MMLLLLMLLVLRLLQKHPMWNGTGNRLLRLLRAAAQRDMLLLLGILRR